MFALNNCLKVKDIPVVIALKVFVTTVLPILTYGADVWAAFERDTCESWDPGLIEQMYLIFKVK